MDKILEHLTILIYTSTIHFIREKSRFWLVIHLEETFIKGRNGILIVALGFMLDILRASCIFQESLTRAVCLQDMGIIKNYLVTISVGQL